MVLEGDSLHGSSADRIIELEAQVEQQEHELQAAAGRALRERQSAITAQHAQHDAEQQRLALEEQNKQLRAELEDCQRVRAVTAHSITGDSVVAPDVHSASAQAAPLASIACARDADNIPTRPSNSVMGAEDSGGAQLEEQVESRIRDQDCAHETLHELQLQVQRLRGQLRACESARDIDRERDTAQRELPCSCF